MVYLLARLLAERYKVLFKYIFFAKIYKQIKRNHTLDGQVFTFDDLLMPFRPPYSISFRDRLHQTRIMRESCFYHFRLCILLSKNNQQKSWFNNTPSWTSFFSFHFDFFPKRSILGPLQNPVRAKIAPKTDQVAPTWFPKNSPTLPMLYFENVNTCRNTE